VEVVQRRDGVRCMGVKRELPARSVVVPDPVLMWHNCPFDMNTKSQQNRFVNYLFSFFLILFPMRVLITEMKIKPENRRRAPDFVYVDGHWVPYEKRKKQARVGQLNKFNCRMRTPSEFLRMCWKLEGSYAA
jgi:hypothetical protein